jgi:hypothetical protein
MLQTSWDDEDKENDKGGPRRRTRKQQSKRGWQQLQGRMRTRTRDNGEGGRRGGTRTQQSKWKTRTIDNDEDNYNTKRTWTWEEDKSTTREDETRTREDDKGRVIF